MFARFDENPAMTLQDIKETKRYGRTDACKDGQSENSIPTTNKVAGGITMFQSCHEDQLSYHIVFLQVSFKQFSVLVCGERGGGDREGVRCKFL